MAQKNIDFGTFPDDPDADAIRTAFQKTQENFTELFSGLQEQAVLSVNKTPGQGISVSSPTGNVVVNANIACVTVTTHTLSLGLNDANGNAITTLENSTTQSITIDLPSNITGVTGANFSGTVTANSFVANNSISSSNTITASGNLTAGNVSTGKVSATGNVTTTANIYANSGIVGASLLTGTLTTAAQPNITSVGTLTSLSVAGSGNSNLGNVATANYFSGDGSGLSNVTALANSTIVNGTSNVRIPTANGNVNISVNGTANVAVVTATGANITGTANISGNANAGNIGAATGVFSTAANTPLVQNGTSNIAITSGANVTIGVASTARITATSTGANINGTLGVSGNANVGNIGGAIGIFTTAANTPLVQNGTSNVTLTSGGNITYYIAGNATARMTYTSTGANLNGTFNATGNANVGNLGTAQILATANVTAPQLISNVATGTAPLVVTSTTQVANLNAATAGAATNAAAVQTNASTATTVYPTFVTSSTNANYALNTVSGISANLANNAITATTFVGTLSGAATSATSATNAAALLQNTSTATTVYPTFTTSSANGNSSAVINTGISANLGNASITATTFVGALSGAATSATTAGTVTTNAQPNITSVGTLSSLSVSGNITGGNLLGPHANGNSNVNMPAANGNVNISVAGNANVLVITGTGVNVAGTLNATGNANVGNLGATGVIATTLGGALTTAAQPNVTSLGTLSSLAVTANITAGNVYANSGTIGASLLTGTLTTAAQPNITSVGTLTSLGVNGNATAVNVIANTGAFYGNAAGLTNIPAANVSGTVATATTADTVTTASQPNITSVGTLSSLSVTGNVSAGNANLGNLVTANFIQGDGSLLTNISVGAGSYIENGNSNVIVDANNSIRISSTGNANVLVVNGSGANINGTANVVGNVLATGVYATLLDGTLTLASNTQPNITSLGTLTALNMGGVANLGAVGNVRISGGSNNQVLVATGSGSNLAFVTATSLTLAPGLNTQVLFNDSGSFAANANMTFDKTTGTLSSQALSVTNNGTFGNVYANSGTVRGSLLTGTLTTAAQPNITSVGSLTSLIVNGNINAGNISGGNAVSANYFIGSGANLTSIPGGNVTGTVANATAANSLLTNTSTATSVYPTFVTSSSNGYSQNYINTGISANLGNASITATTFVGTLSGAATSATTAGTVTTNAQPNITSVGTLTGLTVNGLVTQSRSIINYGAVTSNIHALTVLQTWNNSSVQFSAIEANITDTASAANSLLLDLQISNVSKFAVSKEGNVFFSGTVTGNGAGLTNISSATSATNAAALLQNTSSATTVYPTFTTSSANGNSQAVFNTSISANLGNASITATTFVGALSGAATTAGTVTTNAQPNITSVGTLSSLAVTGNGTFGNILGPHANGNSNVNIPAANGNVNISAVGTTNVLVITGTGVNVAGTLNTGSGVITGNGSGLSAIAGANITGQVGNALVAGTVYTNAQPNITSVGTLSSLAVTGNVTAGNIVAPVANGNSNVNIPAANGNVNISAVGNANVLVVTGTGVNVAGTLNATGNANVGNIGAARGVFTNIAGEGGNISNIQGANVSGTVSSATAATNASALLQNTSTSTTAYPTFTTSSANGNSQAVFNTSISANLGNASITATTFVGTLSGAATTAATVTTAAQPNITSVGTLTSLGVNGTVTAVAFTANTGVFTGNGNGLSSLQGSNVTGQVGNALVAGTVYTAAQPNITSTGTLTSLTVSGNIAAQSNVNMTGYMIRSVNAAVSAAGTVQANATAITKEMNVVSTVAAGAGVILPTAVAGMAITIINTSANSLLVYPHVNGDINGGLANSAYSHPAGATLQYVAPTTTDWYTVGATFA